MNTTAKYRRFYAELIVRSTGEHDCRLIEAFAQVPREDYVGKGPWPVATISGYMPTISDDPSLLYQDILIGLDTDRHINNGLPTLHARCLAAAAPLLGETVVHIGTGTGYYTAVLAALAGPTGHVVGFEYEKDLAAKAAANLRHLSNVKVLPESATEASIPPCDVIYVNAGVTRPPLTWLHALPMGGRMVFPLTPNEDLGVMLKVVRKGATTFSASTVTRVSFIPCIGARDDSESALLSAAFKRRSPEGIQSLHVGTKPDETAWCVGNGWWFSTMEIREA